MECRLYPSESSEHYHEILQDIQSRGVDDILLFVSDGLIGLREVCVTSFPHARHQYCWVYIIHNISRLLHPKDKATILGELKKVYQTMNQAEVEETVFQ